MKESTGLIARLIESRKRLAQQMPDPSIALAGSLMSRMIRCNKPGCRFCEKGKGPGHGPIWILSVNLGGRRVRQIPVPKELRTDVEAGLRRFSEIQKLLKRIAALNQQLLLARKRA
ncbi:MAG: hypothetical protein JOZ43_08100 [Acidobacteriales bacterium]|nr:hypothetical protein [Terriglobales bacterium]